MLYFLLNKSDKSSSYFLPPQCNPIMDLQVANSNLEICPLSQVVCSEVASLINDIPNSNRWWKNTLTYCMAVDITIEESHLTTKASFEEAFLCVVLNEAHLFDPDPVELLPLPTAEDAMDTARAICDNANLSTQTNFRQKLWSVRPTIGCSLHVSRRAFLSMVHD